MGYFGLASSVKLRDRYDAGIDLLVTFGVAVLAAYCAWKATSPWRPLKVLRLRPHQIAPL